MDRGYLDFERLYWLNWAAAFVVARTKDNVQLQRRYSHPLDPDTEVRSDHTVLATRKPSRNWMTCIRYRRGWKGVSAWQDTTQCRPEM